MPKWKELIWLNTCYFIRKKWLTVGDHELFPPRGNIQLRVPSMVGTNLESPFIYQHNTSFKNKGEQIFNLGWAEMGGTT